VTSGRSTPRPPGRAAWLVRLFVDADGSDPVLGDLSEEFSTIAAGVGLGPARRWYWQQSARTIPHLAWRSIRLAPGSTGILVVAGLLMVGLADLAGQWALNILLMNADPSDYISGVMVGRLLDVVRFAVVPGMLGWALARMARGREVVVTSLVAAVMEGIFVWNVVILFYVAQREWPPLVTIVIHMGTTVPLALMLGGVLRRSRTNRPA
jgi:hypothetical protein